MQIKANRDCVRLKYFEKDVKLRNQFNMLKFKYTLFFIIVRWLKGEVRDIFWEDMPLCFSGSKFTQVYENRGNQAE